MRFLKDKRGISVFSIMLLALLVLSVVLLNGISIVIRQKEKIQLQKGKRIAISYCAQSYEKFPPECKITKVFQCDNKYLLRSSCLGVGDVVLNQQGKYVKWCGYTSLDGRGIDCGQYWIDAEGNDCTQFKNLCL